MYLCYLDESGTPQVPGNTSHYVLAGLSVPIWHWKNCDREISAVKAPYGLQGREVHTAWIARAYLEQSKIKDFEKLSRDNRRSEVEKYRRRELLRLQKGSNHKLYRTTKKRYKKTEPYIHLTYNERRKFLIELAKVVSDWGFARLFAEAIDKVHFDPTKTRFEPDEQGFEQVVSRFEQHLNKRPTVGNRENYGLLIHDNNPTSEKKLTEMMKEFHRRGTFWTRIKHIVETPLFVNSELTGLVQIADLCSYAIRRYEENGEEELFDLVFKRAERFGGLFRQAKVVSVRHFTDMSCQCKICVAHR